LKKKIIGCKIKENEILVSESVSIINDVADMQL
jgi:hypothetical protein